MVDSDIDADLFGESDQDNGEDRKAPPAYVENPEFK